MNSQQSSCPVCHSVLSSQIFNGGEKISKGETLDTLINLKPSDFKTRLSKVETMNYFELNNYIKEEEIKGTANIVFHKIEKHKRMAFLIDIRTLST